jgi:uncharacterized delta-60 repeat protein
LCPFSNSRQQAAYLRQSRISLHQISGIRDRGSNQPDLGKYLAASSTGLIDEVKTFALDGGMRRCMGGGSIRKYITARSWVWLGLLLCGRVIAYGQYWERDPSFAATFEATSLSPQRPTIVPSPGGKLVFAAPYAVNGSATRGHPVRLDSTGKIDSRFNVTLDGTWTVLAAYPDSRVLAIRSATDPRVNWEIVRFLDDGAVDPTFTRSLVSGWINRTVILSDGRILVVGWTSRIDSAPGPLAVLGSNGGLAANFQSPFPATDYTSILSQAVQLSDGRILIAGSFNNLGSTRLNAVARLNGDGSIDTGFNANALGLSGSPDLLTANADGSVLIRLPGANLVRLTATGARDPNFTAKLSGSPISSQAMPDGKIYYLSDAVSGTWELRRANADGSLDSTFVTATPSYTPYSVALPIVTDTGAVYVSSPITPARANAAQLISHLGADGTVDPNFVPRFGSFAAPISFLRLTDGKVLVVGTFDYVNGVPSSSPNRFLRMNADGSVDSTFVATLAQSDQVSQLYLQPSGKILARGAFTVGSTDTSLVRFNADGSRDASFSLTLPLSTSMAVDSAGSIYAVTNESVPRLLRYTLDGQLDGSFQSAKTGPFGLIVPMFDGSVVLLQNPAFVKLRHDGTIDASFTNSFDVVLGDPIWTQPLSDGRLAIVTQNNSFSGTYFRAVRLTTQGVIDYTYVGRPTGSSNGFGDFFNVAGACLDLMRQSSPGVSANFQSQFIGPPVPTTMYLDTTGTVIVQGTGSDRDFSLYRRTSDVGPSVDLIPAVLQSPFGHTASLGTHTFLGAQASGLFPMTYQWFKDGQPVVGATSANYFVDSMQMQDAGTYTVTMTNAYGSVATAPVSLTVSGAPSSTGGSARLANISSRGYVGSGDETMIAGFAVSGTAQHTVLIRAVGPTLGDYGVGHTLTDPKLTLFSGSTSLFVSDDWGREGNASAIAAAATKVGAFPLPPTGKDAVLLVALKPGNYTAQVSAASGEGGIALIEVYDVDTDSAATDRLTNIATRCGTGSGEAVLTAGFAVRGNASKRLLIRASGPALTAFGVSGVVDDPFLSVLNGQTLLQSNDDWNISDATLNTAITAVGAFPFPSLSRDAAVLLTLAPGNYTAQVTTKSGSTGVALIEVYDEP